MGSSYGVPRAYPQSPTLITESDVRTTRDVVPEYIGCRDVPRTIFEIRRAAPTEPEMRVVTTDDTDAMPTAKLKGQPLLVPAERIEIADRIYQLTKLTRHPFMMDRPAYFPEDDRVRMFVYQWTSFCGWFDAMALDNFAEVLCLPRVGPNRDEWVDGRDFLTALHAEVNVRQFVVVVATNGGMAWTVAQLVHGLRGDQIQGIETQGRAHPEGYTFRVYLKLLKTYRLLEF